MGIAHLESTASEAGENRMKSRIRFTMSDVVFDVPKFDINFEELYTKKELTDEERQSFIEWIDTYNVRRIQGAGRASGGTETLHLKSKQKVSDIASIQHNRVPSVEE